MLLGFKRRFIEPIENGSKIFTIRDERKVMPKISETLYMYTGLRTKNCALITKQHQLNGTQKVTIEIEDVGELPSTSFIYQISVDGRILRNNENWNFAISDGFKSLQDFLKYWLDGKKEVVAKDKVMFHWTDFRY